CAGIQNIGTTTHGMPDESFLNSSCLLSHKLGHRIQVRIFVSISDHVCEADPRTVLRDGCSNIFVRKNLRNRGNTLSQRINLNVERNSPTPLDRKTLVLGKGFDLSKLL